MREIAQEGLLWGGAELIPVAYGVKKLRIVSVVVDDLVSVDDLQEKIEAIEDCQSTDIHAFNKVRRLVRANAPVPLNALVTVSSLFCRSKRFLARVPRCRPPLLRRCAPV